MPGVAFRQRWQVKGSWDTGQLPRACVKTNRDKLTSITYVSPECACDALSDLADFQLECSDKNMLCAIRRRFRGKINITIFPIEHSLHYIPNYKED